MSRFDRNPEKQPERADMTVAKAALKSGGYLRKKKDEEGT
jgi:hypothetical protein